MGIEVCKTIVYREQKTALGQRLYTVFGFDHVLHTDGGVAAFAQPCELLRQIKHADAIGVSVKHRRHRVVAQHQIFLPGFGTGPAGQADAAENAQAYKPA